MPLSPSGSIFQSTDHFEVGVILGRAQRLALAVKNQHAVFNLPVVAHLQVGFFLLIGQFGGRHLGTLRRVGEQAFPTGQIPPVKAPRSRLAERCRRRWPACTSNVVAAVTTIVKTNLCAMEMPRR